MLKIKEDVKKVMEKAVKKVEKGGPKIEKLKKENSTIIPTVSGQPGPKLFGSKKKSVAQKERKYGDEWDDEDFF